MLRKLLSTVFLMFLCGILNQLLLILLCPNLSEKSSTSTVFKSRFDELRQKHSDLRHMYTDGSKIERKVASASVCSYGTMSYRLRDGRSDLQGLKVCKSFFSGTLCNIF